MLSFGAGVLSFGAGAGVLSFGAGAGALSFGAGVLGADGVTCAAGAGAAPADVPVDTVAPASGAELPTLTLAATFVPATVAPTFADKAEAEAGIVAARATRNATPNSTYRQNEHLVGGGWSSTHTFDGPTIRRSFTQTSPKLTILF